MKEYKNLSLYRGQIGNSNSKNDFILCLDPHLNLGWGWRRETGLNPPVNNFHGPFQGGYSFVDHLFYLCLVFLMLLRLFIAALWSPGCKELTFWLFFVMFNTECFCHFPMWNPGPGAVLDCIDS